MCKIYIQKVEQMPKDELVEAVCPRCGKVRMIHASMEAVAVLGEGSCLLNCHECGNMFNYSGDFNLKWKGCCYND